VAQLEDGGWALTQNTAILNYIADMYPQAALGGDGTPRSRAEVNRWLGFLNSDVHPAFKPLFGATGYLEDALTIARTQAHARAALRGLFQRADAQLLGREWLAGLRSIADPYLFVVTRWAKASGVDLTWFDNLERHFRRMSEDPAVRRVLADEGLD
jgi:glutathione S-transferase